MRDRSRSQFLFLLVVLASWGCGGDDDATMDSGTDSGPSVDSAGIDANTGVDSGPDSAVDAGPPVGWQVQSHPCPGINRTDALHADADGSIWIGCGSGAEGRGLFVSRDGGVTWDTPATNPSGVLETFRVLSIHRGYGGLVYVSGEGPSRAMVISLDTGSSPFAAAVVLTRGSVVGTSFLSSPFVTTSSGAAFADSFNGHDALYRPDDGIGDDASTWTAASAWEDDGGTSHQILDLVVHNERFVGCGSTIAEPPFVYLPSETGMPYQMTPVELAVGLGSFTGEMWGVAASDDRVIAVGVDQDRNVGKIFISGADRYDGGAYTQIDISPLLPTRIGGTDSTWARGVCMSGDRVVVVGEIHPLGVGDNTGFVLESNDGGVAFEDVTPDGSPDTWSKCAFRDDELVVAGAGAIGITG